MPITEAESELVGLGRRYRLAWQQIATMRGTRLPGMCRRIPLESQVRARELVVGEPGLPPREVVRPVAWVCHWFTVYLPDQGWQETPDWPSSLVRAGGAQRAAIRVARTTRRSLYWPAKTRPPHVIRVNDSTAVWARISAICNSSTGYDQLAVTV